MLLLCAAAALTAALAACARRTLATQAAPCTTGDCEFTLRVAGLDRHYSVHVPPPHDATARLPVVLMLHGGGGSGPGAAYETGWSAKADRAGFLAVFPDAMPPDPTRRRSFARNPQLWNDGSDRFYPGQNAVDDVGFINALLDDLAARFRVDPARIFVAGFSNGGSMSFRVGAELSPRIAAIAVSSSASWVHPQTIGSPLSLIYITGTEDPLNRIDGGVPKLASGQSDSVRAKPKPPVRDSIMIWVRALGCPDQPRSTSSTNGVHTEIYGPGRGGAEVEYITVDGLGHTWAGGRSLLPEFMVGKRTDKISATDVIWDFFARHPKVQPAPDRAAAPP